DIDSAAIAAPEVHLADVGLQQHAAIGVLDDLELGAPDACVCGVAGDREGGVAGDQLLNRVHGSTGLLADGDVAQPARAVELGRGESDLGAGRQPGDAAVLELDQRATLGIGADLVVLANLHA